MRQSQEAPLERTGLSVFNYRETPRSYWGVWPWSKRYAQQYQEVNWVYPTISLVWPLASLLASSRLLRKWIRSCTSRWTTNYSPFFWVGGPGLMVMKGLVISFPHQWFPGELLWERVKRCFFSSPDGIYLGLCWGQPRDKRAFFSEGNPMRGQAQGELRPCPFPYAISVSPVVIVAPSLLIEGRPCPAAGSVYKGQ